MIVVGIVTDVKAVTVYRFIPVTVYDVSFVNVVDYDYDKNYDNFYLG